MLTINGMSIVRMNIVKNSIEIMIIFVVWSIFNFVRYYIGMDVSKRNFEMIMLIFLTLIILILKSIRILMFLRWEGIGVISMLLIAYWMRPSGKSGAMSAIIYNRWGDLIFMVIMFQIIGEVSEMLLIFAIICKSSLYLWGYWLPVAMEGPTPVSSLLHSSTIVVAGVYLMILISVHVNHILLVVLLLSLNIIRHFDVKKNIAYSTSIHLLIILILGVMRMYHAVIVYIMLHRIVKGQVFQKSGYRIHAIRSQDMRVYTVNGSYYLMCIGIFILSAILGMVIVGAKELVVLGGLSVSMLFLVVVSYMYTLQYINKVIMREWVGEMERMYVLVIIVLSIVIVELNFSGWVGIVVGFVLVIWIGNPMSTLA